MPSLLPVTLAATLPALDLVVIGLYFLATAVFAVWFGRRNDDTEGYFLGGRNVPGWAVGLSLIGTSISSVSFIALPAAAFVLDWRLLVANYAVVVGMLVAIAVFVPLFRSLPYTTAYEFLEARLGRFSRLYCALAVILAQLLRLGTVLFLVSVTISVLMDVPVVWVIVLGGLFILLYTVFGGIEVVIWTDVVQTIILWGGAIVMLCFVASEMPDGFSGGLTRAWNADKFSVGEFHWAWGERTFWTLLFVGVFDSVANNASNQTVVQRYIAASSLHEARKAVWISLLLSIPTWTFFYFIGTLLWAFYTALPDPTLAAMTPEEVVPHFTLHYLPVGVTGLIVAAIIAASMSSLDSSINAISTIGTTDVLRRYVTPDASEKQFLRYAKLLSAAAGAAMIGIALVIATLQTESIVDFTRQVTSIFGGVVAGIFLLAIFVPRVGPRATLTAMPFAIALNGYYACVLAAESRGWIAPGWQIPLHVYWIGTVSNLLLMVLAYAFSFVWPRSGEPALPIDETGAEGAPAS